MIRPKIVIAFLGNISYDSRSRNLVVSLKNNGYDPSFIGFDWLTRGFISVRDDNIYVKKLSKRISVIFYLKFAFLLTFKLFQSNAKFYLAEDIYTLPFVAFVSYFKKAKVIYDSREIYAHLAGLSKRKTVQMFWRWIEKTFIKSAYVIITTGEMDSAFIEKEYNLKETVIIRNLPLSKEISESFDFRDYYKISEEIKILLYQGVILPGRGLSIIFEVMNRLENCVLVILGDGEYKEHCQKTVKEKKLEDKVFFFGKVKQNDLLKHTSGADIGLAIIENLSLSYYYALPNKMFEYIYCGLPVIASNLPQMKSIIDKYQVGLTVNAENHKEIVDAINLLVNDEEQRNKLIANCRMASLELNWGNEIKKLYPFLETMN